MPSSGDAPAISVIIATCGREPFLLDCVASILGNVFQDFEIIIVDQDRARTLPGALRRRFGNDTRLVYVALDQANLSRARNAGVQHARADIVVFSDDDVEVSADWLSAYVEAFAASGGVPAVVGGRLEPLWLTPRPHWLPESKEYLLGIYDKHHGFGPMPEHDLPIGANFAAHRKVIDAVGPFDERVGPSYTRKRGMIFGDDSLFSLYARRAHYPIYHQASARARHKMLAHKVSKRWFIRRCFWEGVTQLTVLHLSGSVAADQCPGIVRWHAGAIARSGQGLARTLWHWRHLPNPAQRTMETLSSIANSAGVIRAAFKLRTTGRLPW
jgi:glycosyltransferase involved in cell wall biosynthesis